MSIKLRVLIGLLYFTIFAYPAHSQQESAPSGGEKILYLFNLEEYLSQRPLNKVWQYDVVNLVSALQGLVNRDRPRLYIYYVREQLSTHQMLVDKFWLDRIHGHDGFLSDHTIVELTTLEELITTFREDFPYFTGVVTWDPDIPATGNLALSIAGANGLLPVRHDDSPNSLFSQIVASGLELPVVDRLNDKFSASGTIPETDIESTGYAKADVYIWGRHNLIEQGETSSEYMAAMLDPFDWDPRAPGYQYTNLQYGMVANHDFYVSKKAFFFDLDPWWDEVATDIPEDPFLQGFDRETLDPILQAVYERADPSNKIIKVGGFVPWWVKYTQEAGGKHDQASTVEEFVSVMSAYSCILDSDNYPFVEMANASVFQHYPLQERYFQNPVTPQVPLENKNYVLFVIGDFRSSALMYQAMPSLWSDSARGSMPITWAFNPLISERVPHIIDWMYKTRTPNDYFAAGATGAGLCFPNRFVPPRNSALGSDLDDWVEMSKSLFTKFDLRTTVAADLDRDREDQTVHFRPELQDAFLSFSPHGVSTVKPFLNPFGADFVPFFHQSSQVREFYERLPSLTGVIEEIVNNAAPNRPVFHIYRFKYANPTSIRYIWNQIQSNFSEYNWQAVNPYTFFYLLRQRMHPAGEAANTLIPKFLEDNLPLEVRQGGEFTAQIRMQNEGWDTWSPPGTPSNQRYRLSYRWQLLGEDEEVLGDHAAFLPDPVPPGQTVDLRSLFKAPTDTFGIHNLILFVEQENVKQSIIQYKKQITVQ